MLKKQNELFVTMFVINDIMVCVGTFFLAFYLKFYHPFMGRPSWVPPLRNYLILLAIVIPIWLTVYRRAGLYRSSRGIRAAEELFRLIKGNFWGLLLFGGVFFFYRRHSYSRQMLVIFWFLNVSVGFFSRQLLRMIFVSFRRKGFNLRYLLLIGAGDLGVTIVKRIDEHSGLGYKIVGFLDDDEKKRGKVFAGVPVLGPISDMQTVIEKERVNEVVFALPLKAHEVTMEYMRKAIQAGVRVRIVPDYLSLVVHRAVIEELDGIPLIGLQNVPLAGLWNRLLKRVFDLVMVSTITIMISPFLLMIALLIKLTSKGPLFYAQERVGLNNRTFRMYKFRTMRPDAEKETGPVWASKSDDRTTSVGRFLRRTSLDELPQLYNVFKGDMSLIGPRPERPFFVKQFREEFTHYMLRHQVKEGITGWAQVNGWRGNTSLEKRVQFDIYYIENWSFLLDIKILWLTLWKGFINKNAY